MKYFAYTHKNTDKSTGLFDDRLAAVRAFFLAYPDETACTTENERNPAYGQRIEIHYRSDIIS